MDVINILPSSSPAPDRLLQKGADLLGDHVCQTVGIKLQAADVENFDRCDIRLIE